MIECCERERCEKVKKVETKREKEREGGRERDPLAEEKREKTNKKCEGNASLCFSARPPPEE